MIPEVHACSGYLVITAPNGRIATTPEPCPHPRSGSRSPAQRSSRVTVTDRCIPLVTAAYGTRVARPARTTRLAPEGNSSQLA
jgi:hypothetical protein